MDSWTLYLITRADSVGTLFFVLSLTCLAGSIIGVVAYVVGMDEDLDEAKIAGKRILKFFVPPAIALMLLATLIPTTKEMIIILGVPELINSERVQSVGGKTLDYIEKYLDEKIEE